MKPARVLGVLYVGVLAGGTIWMLTDPKGFWRTTGKARKKVEKSTGARLPRPEIQVVGPEDQDAFDAFDESLCEAALEVNLETPDLLANDEQAFVDEVAKRTLAKLYPDFPWPATSGDHPSAAELQGLVKYEVRRSILDETLCLTEGDLDNEDDLDDEAVDDDNFIPPPQGG